jgi:hypothetical protein
VKFQTKRPTHVFKFFGVVVVSSSYADMISVKFTPRRRFGDAVPGLIGTTLTSADNVNCFCPANHDAATAIFPFFFLWRYSPNLGPWPTSMKLSVLLRFFFGGDLRHQVLRPLLAYCTAPDDR